VGLPLSFYVGESSHYAGEMAGTGLAGLRLGDGVLGVGVGGVSNGLGDGWESPLDNHALLFRVAGVVVVIVDVSGRRIGR